MRHESNAINIFTIYFQLLLFDSIVNNLIILAIIFLNITKRILCRMKAVLMLILLVSANLFAYDQSAIQLIQVSDNNNELVSGAKIELIGTGKVYYTNSRGECYIPMQIFKQCQSVKIDCVSYKSTLLKTYEISSKIILVNR